jgi:hypothetical protein
MPAYCDFANTVPSFEETKASMPMSRNPQAYLTSGASMVVPPPPPSNFSESGVRRASTMLIRPPSAPPARNPLLDGSEKFNLRLEGVAPADRCPVYECGTTPKCGVRAYVSDRSNGIILYQSRENGSKNFDRPK